MARRKKYILSAKELPIYDEIVSALSKIPKLSDYDMDTVQITVLKKITPQIKDIDTVIKTLKRNISIKGKHIHIVNGQQLVIKTDIIKLMGISRPTLDKWIADGYIIPEYSEFLKKDIFPPNLVLKQLEKYKEEKK